MKKNKKVKILYINGSFINDSGCGVIAEKTSNLFKNNGFEVEIFTSKGFCYDKNYKYSPLFPEMFNTPKKYLKNIFKYYYNLTAAKNLEKVLKDFRPDIIHVHSLRASSLTYSALKPCIDSKVPIIMTLHDCFLVCPMMTLIKSNRTNCKMECKGLNKLPCVFNNCGNNLEQSFRFAMMSFINKLTGYDKYIKKFITPSNALKNLILSADIGIDKNRITTVNNFISNDELKTVPNYDNKGYFLYTGRLSREKGIHYLLQAMTDLPKEIQLHVVGTGPQEKELKEYAQNHNLDNVKFLGFKKREDIKKEYQNCIATILPCNWFENFPTTNMESFINGKPVVASDIGGIPEQVENNKTGLLFKPANVEQLKECIMTYWNNPELATAHGKNAYQKAITQYTEERYYNDILQIYKEVLYEN